MKTNNFWSIIMMLVLAIGTTVAFSSCSKDDEGDEGNGNNNNTNTIVGNEFGPSRVFMAGLLKSYCGGEITYNADGLVSRFDDYSITYLSYDKDGYNVVFADKDTTKSITYKCKVGNNKFFSNIDYFDNNNVMLGSIVLSYDGEGHLTHYSEKRLNSDGSTRRNSEFSFVWTNGDIVQSRYLENGKEKWVRDISYSTDTNVGGITMFDTFYGDCDIEKFYLCGGAGVGTKHLPIASIRKDMWIKDIEWSKDSEGRAIKCTYKCYEDMHIGGGIVDEYTREFVWE